ncbi:MAG TPA: 50S ribosomal protein L6, partial [Thermodesulfobacteriota bacterium]
EISAKIRNLRPPDSYKGKGIRYTGETLKLKPGKAGAKK